MTRLNLPRAALLALWWGTVAATLHDGGQAGAALLQQQAGLNAPTAWALVLLGCAWDAALGAWMLVRPGPWTYRVAAVGVVGMTVLATVLTPRLWLDPFGALLKNLPVLVLLEQLARTAPGAREASHP